MYTPDDTRKMVFSLREVMNYHTKKIPARDKTSGAIQREPGELLRFVTNPMEAVIKKNSTSGNYEINTLGHTLSRWREIRYIGTRLEVVPLATTGKIDPDDITQSASGIPRSGTTDEPPAFAPQGSIHPYDAINFVSYRRWTGGNISVAAWDGSGLASGTSDDPYVQRCLAYDQSWLADERFNHVKLTDGFKFDAVPLRVDLETAALAGNSLFGFSTPGSIFPDFGEQNLSMREGSTEPGKQPIGSSGQTAGAWLDPGMEAYFQPRGLIMPTAGNQYHEEGWLPNPLAGFHYTQTGTYTPGNDKYVISGFYDNFPWFADRTDISSITSTYTDSGSTYHSRLQSFDLNYLVKLVIERFINPLALIRFPCAYGTMFFWNIFMEHILEVRKPFLVNSTWNAGKVQVIANLTTPLSSFTNEKEYEEFRTPYREMDTISCISPDPYGLSEEPSTVTLSDLTPTLGYRIKQEPRTFRNPNPDTEQEPEDPEPAESIPHT